jgi:hypothetical protein
MKLIKDFDVQDEDPIKTNHTSTILGRSCFMNQQEKLLEVSFLYRKMKSIKDFDVQDDDPIKTIHRQFV